MQLAAAKNTATTEDEYLAIINAKTAALFSAAAEVGRGDRPAPGRRAGGAALLRQAISASPSSSSTTRSTMRVTAAVSGNPSATISARARSRFRSFCRSGAARATSASSGTAPSPRARSADGDLDQAISLMRRHKAIDATFERARSYGVDRARCAGDLSGQPREGCARAGHHASASAGRIEGYARRVDLIHQSGCRFSSSAAALSAARFVSKSAKHVGPAPDSCAKQLPANWPSSDRQRVDYRKQFTRRFFKRVAASCTRRQ